MIWHVKFHNYILRVFSVTLFAKNYDFKLTENHYDMLELSMI